MRTLMLSVFLMSLTWVFAGCGDGGSPPTSKEPGASVGPALPGVPTEGPEAPRAKKK
jgi:hypothetical protein